MRIATPLRHRSRGQAIVESAMVLPILILLVMGVIDVGRVIFAHVALQEATQEGAIYGAYNPLAGASCNAACQRQAVRDRVIGSSSSDWVSGASVTVCHETTAPAGWTTPFPGILTVQSTYPLDLLTPIVPDILGTSTVTLSIEITATNFGTDPLAADGCTP